MLSVVMYTSQKKVPTEIKELPRNYYRNNHSRVITSPGIFIYLMRPNNSKANSEASLYICDDK